MCLCLQSLSVQRSTDEALSTVPDHYSDGEGIHNGRGDCLDIGNVMQVDKT